MTPLLFVLASAAAAVLRLAVTARLQTWAALLAVNVGGSAALGAIVGADLSTGTRTVLGVGCCGALTTFSSFAHETWALGTRWGLAYVALTIGSCCGAASITM